MDLMINPVADQRLHDLRRDADHQRLVDGAVRQSAPSWTGRLLSMIGGRRAQAGNQMLKVAPSRS